MLCLDRFKIMLVTVDCQGFFANISVALFYLKSFTYKINGSKYFKNIRKKISVMKISNITTYSGMN